MKYLLLLLTLLCFKAQAQFAVITDPDGFANIRKDKSRNSAIVTKLNNNSIVRIWDEKPEQADRLHVYYQTNYETGIEGYVHKSRLKFLSDFRSIKNVKSQDNFCSAKNDSLTIKISSLKFISKNHRIKHHKQTNSESGYYESIDGKPIWGRDGDLPTRTIDHLSVSINNKSITIPNTAFNDLYEPRFNTLHVYIDRDGTFYIELDNSDGAGYYSVIWTFSKGRYISRHLDRGI